MKFNLILITLTQLSMTIDCLRILLVIPGITKSIILFNDRLTKVLLSDGHEVHQLINHSLEKVPFTPDENVTTLTEFYPTDQFPDWINATKSLKKLMAKYAFDDLSSKDMAMGMRVNRIGLYYQCQQLMNTSSTNQSILEKYRKMKFDVMLGHVYLDMLPVFADQLGVPLMLVSGGNYILEQTAYRSSLPMTASYIPIHLSSYSDRMSFRQRMTSLIVYSIFIFYESVSNFGQMSQKTCCHENIATPINFGQILHEKPQQLLLNGEQIIDFPRPISSFVHYVGELAPKTFGKSLNSDFVSGEMDGIIIFSLGSVADTRLMPESWKMAFLGAFAQFPTYRIVWKFDTEMPEAEKYPHIRLSYWVPQRELLSHKSMKLFITHGGYNSLVESCHAGVPLLMIPLFVDQYGNAQRADRLGVAKILSKMELTEDNIATAINTMLRNETFKERSNFVSRIIGEHVSSAKDMLLHRVKRVSKQNQNAWNNNFYAVRRLNLFQYYCLDVLMFITLVVLFELFIILYIFYTIKTKFC